MTTLIIDNYDSFTFNLYQLIGDITGDEPIVIKNDDTPWEDLLRLDFDSIIISPGPGRPERDRDFGLSRRAILELNVPLLGVCLGHQGICHAFGGSVIHASEPMHGRLSSVHHDEAGLFDGLPSPFQAVRYHSLVCAEPLPSCLVRTAWTTDGALMGLAHRTRPIWGVQFHPESISTEYGRRLLKNFTVLVAQRRRAKHVESRVVVPNGKLLPAESNVVLPNVNSDAGQPELFVRAIPGPVNTPALFKTLFAHEDNAFWLDSSLVSDGAAQFSIMGAASAAESETLRYYAHEKKLVIQRGTVTEVSDQDIFSYLKREISRRAPAPSIGLPFDFNCGYVGYFGYELKAAYGHKTTHRSDQPDCILLFVDRCVVIDHQENDVYLLYLGGASDVRTASSWFDSITPQLRAHYSESVATLPCEAVCFEMVQCRDRYLRNINTCLEHLRNGESYEVCLTNKLKGTTKVDPLQYYELLRRINPAPYSAYLKFPEVVVACSSPERFLSINSKGVVETKPIKGTMRRGASLAEDEQLRQFLACDQKSQSENLMIVDLLRNDLGSVCRLGSVSVPKLMSVETYATLHQLVSTIIGHLRSDQSAVDCLRAAFPGGSMTGAPKRRTMEIIDELEDEARGVYSGSIGYLALNGSADLNIVIRTALFANNEVTIGVGGAIVAMSDPKDEWDEILLKAKALVNAFEQLH